MGLSSEVCLSHFLITATRRHQLAKMARKKAPSKKRGREPKGSASKKEPAAKKAKKDEEEAPAVEYKTVPCKKYWTIGHCELGPKCVYIHQEVSDAMAKQIVANNGELPPSVSLSVAVKPIPNVGAKNIRSLPRGRGACAAQRARGSTSTSVKQSKSAGAEYDGYIGIGCNCKRWGSDHFLLEC